VTFSEYCSSIRCVDERCSLLRCGVKKRHKIKWTFWTIWFENVQDCIITPKS